MHLDTETDAGRQWIADHIGDFDGDLEWLIETAAFTCEECNATFTEAREVGYGEDDSESLCIDCACDRGADRAAGRRYGERG